MGRRSWFSARGSRSLAPQRVKIGSIRARVIISVGGKEAPQSLTKIEAAAYGGAPSAQGSRALDRGRDAMARPSCRLPPTWAIGPGLAKRTETLIDLSGDQVIGFNQITARQSTSVVAASRSLVEQLAATLPNPLGAEV
jgi:hypothetical protein